MGNAFRRTVDLTEQDSEAPRLLHHIARHRSATAEVKLQERQFSAAVLQFPENIIDKWRSSHRKSTALPIHQINGLTAAVLLLKHHFRSDQHGSDQPVMEAGCMI